MPENTDRRLLVTGASGTLGAPLTERAAASGWYVTGTCLAHPDRVRAGRPVRLDLRDPGAVHDLVRAVRPDVIIHTAVTERSGAGFADAIRLAGRHVVQAAVEVGARLVALSTDLVFDGAKTLYTEDSPPQPAPGSDYGHAKVDMERDTLAICPGALVVRTSLIYDFDPANAQVAWMLRAIERGERLRLFVDQVRCPIWAVNLADVLLELADTDAAGLLHVVGPEPLSRYDLGTALLDALGIDPALHVDMAQAPGSRPKSLVLDITRARSIVNTPLLTVAQARARWETSRNQ
ncbi:MAG: SDR family oxidoreductase [Anaerolineae bacterium]|nr:SDR family oxidoreductase [Anaerolineae bacterium]